MIDDGRYLCSGSNGGVQSSLGPGAKATILIKKWRTTPVSSHGIATKSGKWVSERRYPEIEKGGEV